MNILIVDDNNLVRKLVSAMVVESGHTPIVASGHIDALESLKEQKIDLILMDIEMPEVDGFELTKIIRKTYSDWIPIIFLSGNDSDNYLSKGIDAGGDDYLTKPVKEVILGAKIKAMARISQMQRKLDEANKRLAILSNLDSLTGLYNRRALEERLAQLWDANRRQESEFSLLMIDIDHFKSFNDNYGHPKGDECLVDVSRLFNRAINRSTDFVARYGGEEFVVVLPYTPIEGARYKAKEIQLQLDKAQIPHEYSTVANHVTVSIGISSTRFGASCHGELIQQADDALYSAKDTGRNKSTIYSGEPIHGEWKKQTSL